MQVIINSSQESEIYCISRHSSIIQQGIGKNGFGQDKRLKVRLVAYIIIHLQCPVKGWILLHGPMGLKEFYYHMVRWFQIKI